MAAMVLPFVLQHHAQWHGRGMQEDAPHLCIEAYDDADRAVPQHNSAAVINILLAPDLRDLTRRNIEVLFDDPNDGVHRDPPYQYDDLDVLQRLTLRALQEWVDETTTHLFDNREPARVFERLYEEFEAAFFSEDYLRLWYSVLSNLAMHVREVPFEEVPLEDELLIRYLNPIERVELAERWQHLREELPAPQIALVQTMRVTKGAQIDLAGIVRPADARAKVVFCIRVLRPGGSVL